MGKKEKLSEYVRNIFEKYIEEGLHICDIATGGGKSYTIGRLTCEFYPDEFERIVILCVQNKLVEGMNREIDGFINDENSKISHSDKIVIENNVEVIKKAINNKEIYYLLDEINHQISSLKATNIKGLQNKYKDLKKTVDGLDVLINIYNENYKNEYVLRQISDADYKLRQQMRNFFESFKKHLEASGQIKKVSLDSILTRFPSLIKVYPQVDVRRKKVLIMTVHKAMYGIDPILSEKIYLQDLADYKKRTLILFDESDQAAVAMRNAIIDMSIDNAGGSKRFSKGYNGYLQYRSLVNNPEHISNEYYGKKLEVCLKKAKSITDGNWKRVFGKVAPYKNIFLDDIEEIETYRRGVFFCGPALRVNIAPSEDKKYTYICYRKKNRHFSLVHSTKKDMKKYKYDVVVPLDKFLGLIIKNNTAIKSQLYKVVANSFKRSVDRFKAEVKEVASNTAGSNHYLGYPTLEREIHTLFSRFETDSEYQYEQQMIEFATNRKNIVVEDENKNKYPDYSVYSQGVVFYQEEVDERDNQHRVRLSCREITTTPEKILLDLVNTSGTSVVLCSATSSCKSVISNFDIKYLKQTLGDKYHTLSKEEIETFDKLVESTYPKDHNIEIVPVERYEYTDQRERAIILPEKYRQMFSRDAIEERLVDTWFRITTLNIKKQNSNASDSLSTLRFQLYRLYQFIEAYHFFITHNDIHSMIFFQNRTGEKDKYQILTLSCLIDGSYKGMKSELIDKIPTDWSNDKICITKDWEDVESKILTALSQDKEAKKMLISAYGSFKAGTNMQYKIPKGLDFAIGDNWVTNEAEIKKDWDAIYLQSPTAYLMMSDDDNELSFEKSLYNVMLNLMMLYERGCLSIGEVSYWLCNALSNTFMFSEKVNPGVMIDKSAWAQTIVEQAVGRLCRTKNKPHTTYILFDESMEQFFDASNLKKSLTKEFKTLAEYIIHHKSDEETAADKESVQLCNFANMAQRYLETLRRNALYFTLHINNDEIGDELDDGNSELPHNVVTSQTILQSFKQTIIMNPVIETMEELEGCDKRLTFISKCYGKWQRDDNGRITYFCKRGRSNQLCLPERSAKVCVISPSHVRLDIMMKNKVIKKHFEKNGFATTWKKEGFILNPLILAYDYAGEIGEEAFKAIILHYTYCTENDIRHLDGKDYELADYIIINPDGSYKIAFDVKNMNPGFFHNDRLGDMPTSEKRLMKIKQLGCELITVNIVEIEMSGMDEIREINGIIDKDGQVIPSAIDRIRKLVNQ